jgi:BolA family transcriptional regulator, general stress-responsive regulator
MTGPVAYVIEEKLAAALAPLRLVVQDQSDSHRGHAGAAGRTETHFRVEVVSAAFEGLNRVARERRVHDILAVELSDRVHALSVSARTPAEDRPNAPSGPSSDVWGFRDAQREKRKAAKAKKGT